MGICCLFVLPIPQRHHSVILFVPLKYLPPIQIFQVAQGLLVFSDPAERSMDRHGLPLIGQRVCKWLGVLSRRGRPAPTTT